MKHIGSLSLLALTGCMPIWFGESAFCANGAVAVDPVVAIIGAERITFDQLPEKTRSELAEAQRLVEQQKHQLDIDYRRKRQKIIETQAGDFLDQKVLGKEVEATGKPQEQLRAELATPAVGDADVQDFYEKHKQQINKPFETIKAQIRTFLTEQAAAQIRRQYLDSLRTKYSARLSIEPLREAVAATGPSRGPQKAAVTIVEFADFQCPYCGQMAPVLHQILEHYPNDVRLVYRQMPLKNIHPNAVHAAAASVCAGEQGKFWEMHDALFANQAALGPDDLTKTAELIKLDSTTFQACIGSSATEAEVAAEEKAGEDAGISGTPGLFVNGRFLDGAVPYERVAAIIEDELKRQSKPVPKT